MTREEKMICELRGHLIEWAALGIQAEPSIKSAIWQKDFKRLLKSLNKLIERGLRK